MTTSESKGRFFLQNESIRIDSHNESIRIANWNALVSSSRAAARRAAANAGSVMLSAGVGSCTHTRIYTVPFQQLVCPSVCLFNRIMSLTDTRSQRTTLYHRFNRSSLSVVIFLYFKPRGS